MSMGAIYFCSTNAEKHLDIAHVFGDRVRPLALRELVEPLSPELDTVVRAKAMNAYRRSLVPLFVEHGALHVDHLSGLPGPMVKIFWEKLGDRLGAIIPPGATRRAQQIQKVCYCDGRRLMVFTGRVEGTIADAPRGTGGLHWEPIFVPDGQTRTLGEMSRAERLAASASAQAFAGLHDEIFR